MVHHCHSSRAQQAHAVMRHGASCFYTLKANTCWHGSRMLSQCMWPIAQNIQGAVPADRYNCMAIKYGMHTMTKAHVCETYLPRLFRWSTTRQVPKSEGMLSNPQQWTILTFFSFAASWYLSKMRRIQTTSPGQADDGAGQQKLNAACQGNE